MKLTKVDKIWNDEGSNNEYDFCSFACFEKVKFVFYTKNFRKF